MSKDAFWAIMDKARDTDIEIMFSNLSNEMAKMQDEDIQMFRAYIGSYMELIVETIWLDMACKVINGYVSDDTSLYFYLWLIAQGETVLLNALRDPDTLSELPEIPFGNADFEMLMGIGFDEDMMDEELEEEMREKVVEKIKSTIIFKDGDKSGDYESFYDGMEDIPNVLPKLIKRAEMEKFDWN
jgi:hypothetical protein